MAVTMFDNLLLTSCRLPMTRNTTNQPHKCPWVSGWLSCVNVTSWLFKAFPSRYICDEIFSTCLMDSSSNNTQAWQHSHKAACLIGAQLTTLTIHFVQISVQWQCYSHLFIVGTLTAPSITESTNYFLPTKNKPQLRFSKYVFIHILIYYDADGGHLAPWLHADIHQSNDILI